MALEVVYNLQVDKQVTQRASAGDKNSTTLSALQPFEFCRFKYGVQ